VQCFRVSMSNIHQTRLFLETLKLCNRETLISHRQ